MQYTTIVDTPARSKRNEHTFTLLVENPELEDTRYYYVSADNHEMMNSWVEVLREHVKKAKVMKVWFAVRGMH